jgi:hypothetical protein
MKFTKKYIDNKSNKRKNDNKNDDIKRITMERCQKS